ncbi:MAG: type I methionyl aminopeptidase [Thermomicrobium sp.]|nr:type I methionyl aminopeptidase [Thermomicrobium sp.]
MSVVLKSRAEIARMQRAGQIVAAVLEELRLLAKPGVTTTTLEARARELIEREGARPSFLGYRGFPAAICTSLNDEVLHGIPSQRRLREGDLLKIDVGAEWDGLHADAAISLVVGRGSPLAERLIRAAEAAFRAAFAIARPGVHLGDLGATIAEVVREHGFRVIEGYTGHGVGRSLHEEPSVPNWGTPGRGIRLREGMTLAIEPMVSAGSGATRVKRDGWTVVTADGSLAAHYEHTIWITGTGAEVLTRT